MSPLTNQGTNQLNKPGNKRVDAVEAPGFFAFWSAYPRKVARSRAEPAYSLAVKRDGPDVIASGLSAWCSWWEAEGTEEKFIPHATTWLNQSRYLDAPPAPRRPEPKGFAAIRRLAERQGLSEEL